MKFLSLVALATSVAALPATTAPGDDDAQSLLLVFHDTYGERFNISMKANGQQVYTDSKSPISVIDDDDYNAYSLCDFVTASGVVKPNFTTEANGKQHLTFQPPAVIHSVSCEGRCLGVYSDCYSSSGQSLGLCCNGYCAADKCRPWTLTSEPQ